MRPLSADIPKMLASAALLLASAVNATVIYRWVDENGRTHVSDTVPENYKKSATRMDSREFEVSPGRRKQAEASAAREKALAEEAAKRRRSVQASAPIFGASTPATRKRPAQGVTESTDCETWRRLYRESQECFGSYRTAQGGIKAEASEICKPIPSPEPKCGPISD